MSKIAIVTDSTAYIPSDLIRKYNLTVTPQVLIWGEETFRDGVDIQPDEFYARLKTAKVMPTTSQVTPITMKTTFEGLIEKGYDVLGIFLSAKLSGTIQSVVQAKEMMGDTGDKVRFVDSKSTAMAMGFQVLATARKTLAVARICERQSIVRQRLDRRAERNSLVEFGQNTTLKPCLSECGKHFVQTGGLHRAADYEVCLY